MATPITPTETRAHARSQRATTPANTSAWKVAKLAAPR